MSFRVRPGLVIATSVALAILCSLGIWQLKRLEWKTALIAQMTERLAAAPIPFDEALARAGAGENMEYQPVFLNGVYAHDLESHVFGTYEGAPGVNVFTPLETPDPPTGERRLVYVNRGFAPQKFRDRATRADGDVGGEVRVDGLLRLAETRRGFEKWLAPQDQPDDNLYFVRDPAVFAPRRKIELASSYIDSFGRESAAPWPRGGLTRVDLPNRHFEYALTWFGLAAALLGVFFAFSFKRD